MRKFLFAALLALPLLAAAATPPKPFEADYEVRRNGEVIGVGHIRLRALPEGGFEMSTRSEGTAGLAAVAGVKREETSRLRWTGDGLESNEYRMRQKAAWNTREQHTRMDPRSLEVTSTYKGETARYAGRPGLLDKQAVTAAMMVAVADGQRGLLRFPIAERKGVEEQRYEVTAAVRLRTAIGVERALRIERRRDTPGGRQTKIWLARNHGWLPLRILQVEEDGERIDLRITAIR